jgi:Rieske Fe-S protein
MIPVSTIPEGITFHNEVIVFRRGNDFTVFSSRCSHLGCKIDRSENDRLVCPCHGSEYSHKGEILKGPSTKPLNQLVCKLDDSSGNLIINMT